MILIKNIYSKYCKYLIKEDNFTKYNCNIIDGLSYARKIQEKIKSLTTILNNKFNVVPKISIILVGDNTASEIYVRNKMKLAEKVGINANLERYDKDIDEFTILKEIEKINQDNTIHGVIVQLPLPDHINKDKILSTISPEKDIDGLNFYNIGLLNYSKDVPYTIDEILCENNNDDNDNINNNVINIKNDFIEKIKNLGKTIPFIPCTPLGCLYLINQTLKNRNENIVSKNCVIFGNSNLVSKPMARLLLQSKATITTLNSNSKNIDYFTNNADIIVSATGKNIELKNIKKDAILIDVGIRKKENLNGITGDLNFNEIVKTNMITPVPKGVGPMTVSSLMINSFLSAIKSIKN